MNIYWQIGDSNRRPQDLFYSFPVTTSGVPSIFSTESSESSTTASWAPPSPSPRSRGRRRNATPGSVTGTTETSRATTSTSTPSSTSTTTMTTRATSRPRFDDCRRRKCDGETNRRRRPVRLRRPRQCCPTGARCWATRSMTSSANSLKRLIRRSGGCHRVLRCGLQQLSRQRMTRQG